MRSGKTPHFIVFENRDKPLQIDKKLIIMNKLLFAIFSLKVEDKEKTVRWTSICRYVNKRTLLRASPHVAFLMLRIQHVRYSNNLKKPCVWQDNMQLIMALITINCAILTCYFIQCVNQYHKNTEKRVMRLTSLLLIDANFE